MAADWAIHVIDDTIDIEDVIIFNSTGAYFYCEELAKKKTNELVENVLKTPSVYIGTWLDVSEETLENLSEALEDFDKIHECIFENVKKCFKEEHTKKCDEVIEFLSQHIGKKIFWISI
jgi:hypothetical protein